MGEFEIVARSPKALTFIAMVLRELAASESLSLEEEYEMQGASETVVVVMFIMSLTTAIFECSAKWRLDEDSTSTPWIWLTGALKIRLTKRLSFIVLARPAGGELATSDIPALPMIGDVNIFLNGTPGDQDFETEAGVIIAGESTLRNVYVPLLPPPPLSAASESITTHVLLSSFPEPDYRRRARQPHSAIDVFVRHRTRFKAAFVTVWGVLGGSDQG